MKNIIYVILIFFLLHGFSLFPEPMNEKKFNILMYAGKYTETDLLPILFSQRTNYLNSYIFVFGVNLPLNYKIRFFSFEAETLFAKHWGIMKHWEMDTFLLARVSNLFYLPMSIAIGEGVSLTSQNPVLENKRKGFYLDTGLFQTQGIESRNFLNYVMVEIDYRVADYSYNPRIFMRVHHRSGVFGLLCPPDPACGSNFITYGVKFSY